MFRCNAPDVVTAAQLAEALAAHLITKADAALLAGPRPSLFRDAAHATAWQTAYNKLPSENGYTLCVLRRCLGGRAGVSDGEFEESTGSAEAASRMDALKPEALAIYLIRSRRGGERIKKAAAIWYADDYKGKRLAA